MRPNRPQGVLTKLFELATRLPWWAGLLSAAAAYALMHPVAMLQMPAPRGLVDVAGTSLAQLFIFLAQLGQYLLPLTFLASAAISGFDLWRRDALQRSVAQDTSGSILRGLPWPDFELLVSEAFRRRGYAISSPDAIGREQDNRLELTRDSRRYLVDCTDWRSWKAGAGALRKLQEAIEEKGACGGFSITSGQFTPEAKHFAADKGIELIDGRHLKDLARSDNETAKRRLPALVDELPSTMNRWRDRIASRHRLAARDTGAREPGIRLDAGRSLELPDQLVPSAANVPLLVSDDAETAAGEELAALIRDERRIENGIQLSAPPVQARERRSSPKRWPRPKFRARRIADTIGMLLGLGILWSTYEWFLLLPDSPAGTPWSLMGAGADSSLLARRLEGIERPASVTRLPQIQRPLGQYRFGPAGRIADLKPLVGGPGSYGSLRELEAAFESKYVPPPECYAWESNNQMVKCGNHRIRTRREFIASGGEESAMLLGSWEDPSHNWRSYDDWVQQQGGDEYQEWQPYAPEGQDPGWRRGGGAQDDQEHALEADPAWRRGNTGEVRRQRPQDDLAQRSPADLPSGYEPEPEGDWRREFAEDGRWGIERDDTQSHNRRWGAAQPTATQADRKQQDSGPDWRQELSRDWGQEQVRQPALSPQQDWRQDWVRGPIQESGEQDERNWIRPGTGDGPNPESGQDWRQDWLQGPQRQSEDSWRRDGETEPTPVERRHWVDEP